MAPAAGADGSKDHGAGDRAGRSSLDRQRRMRQSNLFGPAGLVSADDGEAIEMRQLRGSPFAIPHDRSAGFHLFAISFPMPTQAAEYRPCQSAAMETSTKALYSHRSGGSALVIWPWLATTPAFRVLAARIAMPWATVRSQSAGMSRLACHVAPGAAIGHAQPSGTLGGRRASSRQQGRRRCGTPVYRKFR